MKCILMNKNQAVLTAELNSNNTFTAIYEILNIDFAPLSIFNSYHATHQSNLKTLNKWFQGRGIPDFRKDLEILLTNLKINSTLELLNKAYALSLRDQYWLKEYDSNITWQNINFFTNNFKYKSYLKAAFSSTNQNIDLYSPNNTTDGMISKAWIIENNKRILIKGTYSNSRLEPINEWLATKICEILHINHCSYTIDIIDKKLVSKCPNFLNEHEEIITANDIFNLTKKDNQISDYDHYLNILTSKGLNNAKDILGDMYLVDFLMLNTDRHMKNYGIIRNVETLKWERITPIFDTGNSLCSNLSLLELNFKDGNYKFFTQNISFNKLIKYINKDKYNLNLLQNLPNILLDKLYTYNNILGMNDEYINKIVNGFKYRLDLLIRT